MKACPFCGSNMLLVEWRTSAWNERYSDWHVICQDCACSAPIYIWNRRHNSSGTVKPFSEIGTRNALVNLA
ncbi:hypothetical protein ECB94_26525 [Vibrio mediterranei]|uniref:Restriction alleviation protein, Lar family n=1 Tax=Vibrio mediterranei TaxID=689 RepID=A0A3G4VKQ6_9VIBR|nr:hypothetical protein ECB94_26525 [Vibrio mediterranei]